MRALIAAGLLAGALALPATAATWQVDNARSVVAFEYTEGGSARTGRFTGMMALLSLDPENLSGSGAKIIVDTATLDLGDALREGVLATEPWLDSGAHPMASFTLMALKAVPGADDASYQATGMLSIKGRSTPIAFPVMVSFDAARAMASGSLSFARRDFALRDIVLESFVEIGDIITLRFDIVARRIE